MAEHIDRRQAKRASNEILRCAQVSPRRFFALYLCLLGLLSLLVSLLGGGWIAVDSGLSIRPAALFVQILTMLATMILNAGCRLYSMAIRRGELAEYLTLLDGLSFAGKIILLELAKLLFLFLWTLPSGLILGVLMTGYGQEVVLSSLVMIPLSLPTLAAYYRYRFALFNLCEDPALGALEAINLSKRQTMGYKRQLLALDLSFFGWWLVQYFPQVYLSSADYMSLLGVSMPAPPSGASVFLQLVIPIAVGCLYLPRYQLMELGYFETAKRTSGASAEGWSQDRSDGPDGLGGYF